MWSAVALFSALCVSLTVAQTPPNCNRVNRPGICCPDGQWPGYPSYRPQFAGDGVCDLINQIPGCFDGGDCCLATVIGDPRNNLTVEEIYNAPYNDNTYVTPLANRPTFDYQVLDIPNREPTCRALLFNCPDPVQVRTNAGVFVVGQVLTVCRPLTLVTAGAIVAGMRFACRMCAQARLILLVARMCGRFPIRQIAMTE